MVKHDIDVSGVQLSGVAQKRPVVLQLNHEDFPDAFLRDLSALPLPNSLVNGRTPLSSARVVPATASVPGTLYQPVARVVHVALVELACESPGFPRLDPKRVLSAGLVIRRVPRLGGVSELGKPAHSAWPWMKDTNGRFGWMPNPPQWTPNDDPEPTRRPQLQSGQPDLDQLLAAQALATAMTESATPAFVAAPEVCNAAQRTLVYAVIPTASNEAATQHAPAVPPIDNGTLLKILPSLLKSGSHVFPMADKVVTYQYMSDDYAKANNAKEFLCFSAALRLLYSSFGAFDGSPGALSLLNILNRYHVTIKSGSGHVPKPMGQFYQEAAAKLVDYDPNAHPTNQAPPQLLMPTSWDLFSTTDENAILGVMAPLLQSRGQTSAPPEGRFQDASRFYRVRMFFRIKAESPACPPELVWSHYSDPLRFGAWHESAGRATAPVPMPDPFDSNNLKNAKPTASFAVPPSLMTAMQGASMTGLSAGTPPAKAGGGISLNWICSFSVPLITICAFFVLNIFLMLLNIVFFWLPFIKICIPIPIPAPSSSTED